MNFNLNKPNGSNVPDSSINILTCAGQLKFDITMMDRLQLYICKNAVQNMPK
eukprot:Pgem_evm1s17500